MAIVRASGLLVKTVQLLQHRRVPVLGNASGDSTCCEVGRADYAFVLCGVQCGLDGGDWVVEVDPGAGSALNRCCLSEWFRPLRSDVEGPTVETCQGRGAENVNVFLLLACRGTAAAAHKPGGRDGEVVPDVLAAVADVQ